MTSKRRLTLSKEVLHVLGDSVLLRVRGGGPGADEQYNPTHFSDNSDPCTPTCLYTCLNTCAQPCS